MPDKQRIDVFISSTSYDLPEHRQAVIDVLNTLHLVPLGMEYWQATGADPVELCKQHVFESEIFVGIYGFRYGWQPDGYDGKSITEMEYEWAGQVMRDGTPIPRLCFIMSDKHDIKPNMMEADKQTELNAFKSRLRTRHVSFFDNIDDLKFKLMASLVDAKKRYDDAPESIGRVTTCSVIPPPPPEFAGRVDDLKQLQDSLTVGTPVAITAVKGVGGIGKTTLVKQFGHTAEGFGLRLWAELGQSYTETLEPSILRSWAKRVAGYDLPPNLIGDDLRNTVVDLMTQTASATCGEPLLLIIDDVWADTVKTARRLIQAFKHAQIIITTRSEEVSALLKAKSQSLETLNEDEGAQLLLNHLNKTRDDVDDAYYADLKRLSNALGGHALALDLAARQLRKNPAHNRLQRWIDTYYKGLDSGDSFQTLKLDTGDDKEDSVAVALRQTLDGLGANEIENTEYVRKFSALGALPSELSFREAHIFALWEADDTDTLDTFLAEGLISPSKDKTTQFSQHRLLRAYARALLRDADELETIVDRHRDYLIVLAKDGFDDRHPETWKTLDDDLEQIHELGNTLVAEMTGTDDESTQDSWLETYAANWLSETVPPELDQPQNFLQTCSDFAYATRWYVYGRYIGHEGRRWLWMGLLLTWITNQNRGQSLFSNHLGMWHNERGERYTALTYFERKLKSDRTEGDKQEEATSLHNIGMVYRLLGQLNKALDYYTQVLTVDRDITNRYGESVTLNNIGIVYDSLGEYNRALDYYTQALLIDQEVANSQYSGAIILTNIGIAYSNLGENDKALSYYMQALPTHREVGNRHMEAVTLNNIGLLYENLGQHNKAADYYTHALSIRIQIGNRAGEASSLNNIGHLFLQLGEDAKALDCFTQALPIRQAVGDIHGEAITRSNMAIIWWEQGKRTDALEYLHIARDIKEKMGISTEDEDDRLAKWRAEMENTPDDAEPKN